jgi:hypothetical protein
LEVLYCTNNQLTSLLSYYPYFLRELYCNENLLTTLDVSYTQLTTLNVSNNPALKTLYCYDSPQLTTLDLSNTPSLKTLYCYDSPQLTTLDVSNNPALEDLSCYNNLLTVLDLSNNSALKRVNFRNNPNLTSVSIKNGSSEIALFTNTPILANICVDTAQKTSIQTYISVNSNTIGNLVGGTTVSDAPDCSVLTTQEISKNKISVYPNPVKDILQIDNGKWKVENAKIYDLSGKLVKTFNGNSVNVSSLQKGIYLLNINEQTFKIIKE